MDIQHPSRPERIGAFMRRNRVLKFFLVPILIILGIVLSERADADFDNAVFPLLQGIEKMVSLDRKSVV